MRLAYVGSSDLRDILPANSDGDQGIEPGSGATLSPSTDVQVSQLASHGWSTTLASLRRPARSEVDRFDVLLTSASAELADPSREPRDALIELVRFAKERKNAHVVVINCSSLLPAPQEEASEGDPIDLRIRRLNLAIIEASSATGLSVLDADRLVAESRIPNKVGSFGYPPKMREVLRSSLMAILGELGFARRAVMEARLPFIGRVISMSMDRWLKSEGDIVEAGDVLCEIRMSGLTRMTRPTNAVVLASITAHGRAVRRMGQERMGRRTLDARIALVANENAVVRKVVQQEGAALRSRELLAVLSHDDKVSINDPDVGPAPLRLTLRSDDPRVEGLL